MSNSSTIKIALKIDDQGGVRVLQNVGKESANTGRKGKKAFNEMDRSAKSFTSSAKMSANTMLKMGAGVVGIMGLAKAWGALTSATKDYIELANIQESAERTLGSVLRATGEAAGYNLDQLKAMASGLQDVTRFGDETTMAGMAILATFKEVGGKAFERATVAAMDMSVVMKTDLKSSMVQIGKALNDPAVGLTALSKAGVTFTESQKDTIKILQESGDMMAAQNIILTELESQFGGAATDAVKDFAGGLDQANNALGDTKEEMGFIITKNQFFIELTHMATAEFVRWGEQIKKNREYLSNLAKGGVLMLVSSLKAGIETLRFFHNGWLGIKLVGQLAVQGLAMALDALYPIIRSLLAPLDALYQGMVKLGIMDVNPFDAIGEGLTTFKDSSAQVTKDVLADINKTNEKYDTVSNTLQGYIDKIKKIPTAVSESAESEKAANKKRLDNLDQLGTATEALTEKELAALQAANQKKYAMDIALANLIGDDTWLIREEGLGKALAQAEDAQTKMTQMEYDESQKRIKQQADAQDKALKEQERAQQHMYDNIHDIIADFWGDALSGQTRDWEDFNDSLVRTFQGTTAELLATWTTGFGDKFNDILNSSVDAIKGMSGNTGASHPDGTMEATKPSNFDWMKSVQYVGAIYSLADGLLGSSENAPPIKVKLEESTVLGAADGFGSQSIANSLANLGDIDADQYSELQGIYDEMVALNSNITGLVTGIVRSFGDFSDVPSGVELGKSDPIGEAFGNFPKFLMGGTGDDLFGGKLMGIVGDFFSSAIGGASETTLQGAGLDIGVATVQSILDGADLAVQKFTETLTYTEGGWFSSSSDTRNTYFESVDSDITGLFTKVGMGIGKNLESLDEYLGTDIDFTDVKIDFGTINLMGLEGNEINEKINEVVSAAYDDVTEKLFGELYGSYQQIGEGFSETVIRLVGENSVIMDMLDKTGVSFAGTTQDAIAFSQSLISVSGDFKSLTTSFSTYYDKFFSEADKQTDFESLASSKLGKPIPETAEGFRDLVSSLDITTEAGRKLYTTLLSLSDGASSYYDYLEKITDFNDGMQDIIDKQTLNAYQYSLLQLDDWHQEQTEKANELGASVEKLTVAYEMQKSVLAVDHLTRYVSAMEDLSATYFELTGETAATTSLIRQQQAVALVETYGDLASPMVKFQMAIWAVSDAAAAATEANASLAEATDAAQTAKSAYVDGLKQELSLLENNLSTAKSNYLDLLEDELQILQDNLTKAKSDYIGLLEDEISAQEQVASSLASAVSSLQSFRKNLYIDSEASATGTRDYALAAVNSLVDQATSGDTEAFSDLPAALERFVDASKEGSTSYVDYARDLGLAARISADMEAAAQSQITEAEEQVNLLQNIVDAVQGVSDDVVSMDQARANYEVTKAALDISDYQAQLDLLTGANQLTSDIAQAEADYNDAKTTLETSWYESEINALTGIQGSIQDLKAAYLDAASAQATAQAQATAAAQAQAVATAAAAQAQADFAAAQAATNADLAAAQAVAAEAARKAAIVLPTSQAYFNANPDVNKSYLSGENAAALGNPTADEYVNWHMRAYGKAEGRTFGTPEFEQSYLAKNPDVAKAIADGSYPFSASMHWFQFGKDEGREYAKGGIISGPLSGYQMPDATFHGTEAIIPMASGKIPVQIADDYYQDLVYEMQGIRNGASGEYDRELILEIRALRGEVNALRDENTTTSEVITVNTSETARIHQRWDILGMPPERKKA